MIYLVFLFWLKHRYGAAPVVTFLYFLSLLLTPLSAQANPNKLDSSCRSLIDQSISSAGFAVQASGFIIDRIRSSSSVDRALANMWSSRTPAEISYSDLRGRGRYYVSLTLPPSPEQRGQVSSDIQERIRTLQASIHRQTICVQTLRIEFARTGPYQCTWFDPRSGSIRQINYLEPPSDRRQPSPGLDYCE